MYKRKDSKTGAYKLLLLFLVLLPLFWYSSLPLSNLTAKYLSVCGFSDTAYFVGKGVPVDILCDIRLKQLKELSELSSTPETNAEKTVFLYFGKSKPSKDKIKKILSLFEAARTEVGNVIGYIPSSIDVRVVSKCNLNKNLGFNGWDIDMASDQLLDPIIIYREVTHLVSAKCLFSGNIPVSFPKWFYTGVAAYVPSALEKGVDYNLYEGNTSFSYSDLKTSKLPENQLLPAFVAVSLIAEKDEKNISKFFTLLNRGALFVEALRDVSGLTEVEFSNLWQQRYNKVIKEKKSDVFSFVRCNRKFQNILKQINIDETADVTDDLRMIIATLDKVTNWPSEKNRERAETLKGEVREKLANQLMKKGGRKSSTTNSKSTNSSLINSKPLKNESPKSDSVPLKRSSPFVTKLIFTQILILLIVLIYYCLKLLVLPLLIIIFNKSFRLGSVVLSLLFLYLFLRFVKTIIGLFFCRFMFLGFENTCISQSGLLVGYWWISSMVLFICGSLLMESSGGEISFDRTSILRSFLSFTFVIVIALGVLHHFGYIKWSLPDNSFTPFVHSLVLAFIYAFAHEVFFRGGLLKSAETKLHVGSSAVLTSMAWSIFIVFPDFAWPRLIVAFVVGMLFCSLVTTTGNVSAATGGAAALHFFNWFILGGGTAPFGGAVFTVQNIQNPLLIPAFSASFTSLFFVPLVFSGWCLTLIAIKRSNGTNRDNRSSRLFISSHGYS